MNNLDIAAMRGVLVGTADRESVHAGMGAGSRAEGIPEGDRIEGSGIQKAVMEEFSYACPLDFKNPLSTLRLELR